MSDSKALRTAAGILLAEADRLDGKVSGPQQMTTYAGRSVTAAEAWALMLEEWARRALPHEWRPWVSGMLPEDSGDNDRAVQPLYDDLLRAFGPFCEAANKAGQKTSYGKPFYHPHIKAHYGLGVQAIRSLRDEIRGLWYSAWGEAWRAHPLNENLIPKPGVVADLFGKIYDQ